jgi:hypothetical protein
MSRKELEAEAIELTIWAVTEWTGDGLTQEEAIDRLAQSVDAALELDKLINGPIGALAEAVDGKLAHIALTGLAELRQRLTPSPKRLRRRASKAAAAGRIKRAESLRRRAKRLEER